MIWQTSTTSSDDTERLGELLGKLLSGGEVIELRSDLGGGKTTFAKGLVRGVGINEKVSSPTFTLSRIYTGKKLQVHHFDFYRLDDAGILRDQLKESFNDQNSIVIIEWADIVKEVLPQDSLSIEFIPAANSSDERKIIFKYPQNQQKLITKAENLWQETRP